MNLFLSGESKAAIAPITVQPAGLNCIAVLFLGIDESTVATTSSVSFISTGTKQLVQFPITMPVSGTYHVYLDIYTEGVIIASYQALEDVVIAGRGITVLEVTGEKWLGGGNAVNILVKWTVNGMNLEKLLPAWDTYPEEAYRVRTEYWLSKVIKGVRVSDGGGTTYLSVRREGEIAVNSLGITSIVEGQPQIVFWVDPGPGFPPYRITPPGPCDVGLRMSLLRSGWTMIYDTGDLLFEGVVTL